MDTVPPPPVTVEAELYERDPLAWLEAQARALRERRLGDLDLDNLAEELEGMARADLREVQHRLQTLILHVIKVEQQPALYGLSWRNTIREQQRQIRDLLEEWPSLRQHLPRLFAKACERAIAAAADEMDVDEREVRAGLASRPPLTVDGILGYEAPPLPERKARGRGGSRSRGE